LLLLDFAPPPLPLLGEEILFHIIIR